MHYDFAIVGAGPAGVVLASRLSEDPACSVVLIEAGPDYPDPATVPDQLRLLDNLPFHLNIPGAESEAVLSHDWGFRARATDPSNPPMRLPRGKVVGGSSAINGSMFVRGTAEDFAAWAALGNTEWSFDKVLPYYRRLEKDLDYPDSDIHGDAGPIPVMRAARADWSATDEAFVDACLAAGFEYSPDHNAPGASGVGPIPRNSADNVRISVAGAYLGPARDRANLTVLADCFARQIILRDRRAVGLRIEHLGVAETIEASEVIVSAGAFGSPLLLLRSGIGPADELARAGIEARHDLPGVGRNLRDHPSVAMFWQRRADVDPAVFSTAPQTFLRFTAPGSAAANDCRIMFWSLPTGGALANTESMQLALYLAASSGHVRLVSADPGVPPEIDFGYLTEQVDRVRMRQMIEVGTELGTSPQLRRLLGSRVRPSADEGSSTTQLDGWVRRNVRTSQHASGTAQLGPANNPLAVVDQTGRVHGIDGLRVADASIMPDCVSQNPHCTVIMIGERIADLARRP
jgi:predicted dehydrogenase (TIGR03970 family)